MEPFTLAVLFVTFASKFAERAGSRSADLLFDYLAQRPAASTSPEQEAKEVKAGIERDPGFGNLIADAINGDILKFTADAANLVYSDPNLLQSFLGISNAHAVFARGGRCPLGKEFLILPPKYLMPDGSSVSPFTLYSQMRKKSVLMRARCRNGHEWLVFPVVADRSA